MMSAMREVRRRFPPRARSGLALLACLLSQGCAHAADSAPEIAQAARPGGWSPAPLDDERIKLAAQRAIESKAAADAVVLTLSSIDDAQRQVVAGTNYKLRLAVTQNGEHRIATAIVWRKLNGDYQLTGWTWE